MKQIMQPISIVVPTLNEAENLPALFERTHKTLSSVGIPYEILVIDDHSTDETVAITQAADPKYNARAILKQGKPGKAFSLLEGFAAADHKLICMIDGDLQYPPEAIKLMYHKMQYCEADIVVTNRKENQTSWLRRLSSTVFNLAFTRLLFGIKYDTQSGLKLFRKNVLLTVDVDPTPWTFDLEFIVRALEQNYVVVSQDIQFSERTAGVAKVHLLSATYEIAKNSFKLWRKTSTSRVKSGYRYSKFMQRATHWVMALTAAGVLGLSLQSSHASALSLDPSDFQPTIAAAQPVTPLLNNLVPSSDDQQPSSDTTTPTNSNQASNSTSKTSTASSSSPNATTTSKATAATTASKGSTNLSVGNASASLANGQTANPSTLKASTGKNATYYPASKLSSSKTQSLFQVALKVGLAGAAFVGLGLLVILVKLINTRMHRNRTGQPVRI